MEALPDEEPAVAPWSRVSSLPSGLRLFVGGSLFLEEGRGVFRSSPRAPLLVVCYDGERESILKRAIWGGRKKNEYWNPFTLPSLLTGFLCLALLAYLSLRSSPAGLPGLVVLSLAAAPGGAVPAARGGSCTTCTATSGRWPGGCAPSATCCACRCATSPRAGAGELTARLPTGESYLMCREGELAVEGEPETRRCCRAPEARESWLFGAVEEGPPGARAAAPGRTPWPSCCACPGTRPPWPPAATARPAVRAGRRRLFRGGAGRQPVPGPAGLLARLLAEAGVQAARRRATRAWTARPFFRKSSP